MLTLLPQVIFSWDSLQQSLVTVVCLTSHRVGVTRYSQGTCLEIGSNEVTSLWNTIDDVNFLLEV